MNVDDIRPGIRHPLHIAVRIHHHHVTIDQPVMPLVSNTPYHLQLPQGHTEIVDERTVHQIHMVDIHVRGIQLLHFLADVVDGKI